jgi:opacity protein-like surface antigen
MKRLVRYSTLIALLFACAAGTAGAQTATPTTDPWYAEFTAGATFGHKSDSSLGGEIGYEKSDTLEPFFEIGRMGNVATSGLDDRAQIIGRAIGGTVSTAQKATYFDAGVRYHIAPRGMWRPYGLLGLGAARVSTETHFTVNGTELTDQQLLDEFGVQLGTDLSGSVTKFFLTFGLGADVPFAKRYVADFSYRYGRIFARSGAIEGDSGVNTQRVQAGIGIRFGL